VSIRTRSASSGRSTLRVELWWSCHCRHHMRLQAGKRKRKRRVAQVSKSAVHRLPIGGRAACKAAVWNPRYSRLGSLRYFGSLRRVVSFLRHRLSAEEPPTGRAGELPVLPTKTHHCTCVLARIRARRIGQVIMPVRVKNFAIFGKALDRKNLLAKFKRSGESTVKLKLNSLNSLWTYIIPS